MSFEVRPYQKKLVSAILDSRYRHALVAWPRRAGKDEIAGYIAQEYLKKFNKNAYIFMQHSLLIHTRIPKHPNVSFFTADEIKSFVNLTYASRGLYIFSEPDFYSWNDVVQETVLSLSSRNNDTNIVFIGTPCLGNSFMRSTYGRVAQNENWFTEALTLTETNHISDEEIAAYKAFNSDPLIQEQELYPSFSGKVEEKSWYIKSEQTHVKEENE